MFQKILFFVLMFSAFSFCLTVDEILDKMEDSDNPHTSKSSITQIVYNSDKSKNVSKLISYSYNKGEKGLMEYVSPARIKGMKILTLNDGDDIWFCSPRTSRIRKIASHQKNQSVNGSDFSYEDLSTKDRRNDYTSTLLGIEKKDNKKCYKIEMKAKDDDEIYKKIIIWIDKERFIGLQVNFYDEYNEFWKKLTIDDVVKIKGYYTPKHIEMKNVLKGTRTVMKMENIEYNIELDESMFSKRYLRR